MAKSQEDKDKAISKWAGLFSNPNRKKVKKIVEDRKKKKKKRKKRKGVRSVSKKLGY